MSSSQQSTTQTPKMVDGQSNETINDEKMRSTQLEIAIEMAERSQKHCVDLQALLEQLNTQLREANIIPEQGGTPVRHADSPLSGRDAEIERLRKALDASTQEKEELAAIITKRDRGLERALKEKEALSKLLAARTAELDEAMAFLPRANSVTEGHVIELVESLNYEISQASNALADSFQDEHRRLPISEELSTLLMPSIRRVGKPIATLLSSTSRPAAFTLLVGFQAFLARVSKLEISRWVFRARAPANATLNSIMSVIRAKEYEAVAVRWSTIGHKYARVAVDDQLDAQEIAMRLADQLADAVALAGHCSAMSLGETSAQVTQRAGPEIFEVSKLILELNTVLGQEIHEGWMSCSTARPGEAFNAAKMNLDFQDEVVGTGNETFRVIGTTALGLLREENDEEVDLLKPKVFAERA